MCLLTTNLNGQQVFYSSRDRCHQMQYHYALVLLLLLPCNESIFYKLDNGLVDEALLTFLRYVLFFNMFVEFCPIIIFLCSTTTWTWNWWINSIILTVWHYLSPLSILIGSDAFLLSMIPICWSERSKPFITMFAFYSCWSFGTLVFLLCHLSSPL